MKQWKKSSRWRAAVKREKDNLRNSWRLSNVCRGTNPFRPVDRTYQFWWNVCRLMILDKFAEKKPFPRNMGATVVRFAR